MYAILLQARQLPPARLIFAAKNFLMQYAGEYFKAFQTIS